MKLLYNGLYFYARYQGWNIPSCHLFLAQKAQQSIAIVTEVFYPVNRGVTVTWGAEELATDIVTGFHLDPEHTLFIEHWPESREHEWDMYGDETWDVVTFTWKKEYFLWGRKYATSPEWERIQPLKLLELIA